MNSFNRILFIVEYTAAESAAAVARFVSLADNKQARLAVLHVAVDPRSGSSAGGNAIEDVRARLKEQATERLQELPRCAGDGGDILIDIRFGASLIEVIRDALCNKHDLVIETSGEGGAHGFLFGGTDQPLLRNCPRPFWILVGEATANYRHILAAVDFDLWEEGDEEHGVEGVLSRRLINLAVSIAASEFSQLRVVHAWDSITGDMIRVFSSDLPEEITAANRKSERREYQSRIELLDNGTRHLFGADACCYLSSRFHLPEGNPRDVIPAKADDLEADLAVMGTVRRTGIPGLLTGNTVEVILTNHECSVLAGKPADFKTPVTLD